MKYLIGTSLIALFFGLMNLGCNKFDDIENTGSNLSLAFNVLVEGEDFEPGTVYEINGSTVTFDVVQYYLGGLQLRQANGFEINLQDQYLLIGPGGFANLNGLLQVSNITDVKFFIGVDSLTNRQSEVDFVDRPASDPLSLKDPSMHWNWNTGYKFLRIDGNADTDGDGIVDTGIAYHLGSDPFLKDFDFKTDIQMQEGNNTVSFVLDLAALFDGVDLSTELDTHTGNNLPLAQLLFDNLSTAMTVN